MILGFVLATFLTGAQIEVIAKVGDQPLGGQLLRLVQVVQGEADGLKEVRTNPAGKARFDFQAKKASEDSAYVVITFVDGEVYSTSVFSSASPPKTPLLLQTFKSSNEIAALRISSVAYAFKQSDEGKLQVEESFTVENPTQNTISPEDPKVSTFKLDLPAQVFNFSYGAGFSEDTTKVEGNQIAVSTRLRPGSHYFSMTYEIDKARHSYSFKKNYSLPVDRVEAFLNHPSLGLPGFIAEKEQKFYQGGWGRLFYQPLEGQKTFSLKLTGLPLNIPWSWWMPFVILTLLGLGALGLKRIPSQETNSIPEDKKDLLAAVKSLRKLRGKNLISPKEYENKKLMLLELLVPHYEQTHDRQTP